MADRLATLRQDQGPTSVMNAIKRGKSCIRFFHPSKTQNTVACNALLQDCGMKLHPKDKMCNPRHGDFGYASSFANLCSCQIQEKEITLYGSPCTSYIFSPKRGRPTLEAMEYMTNKQA
jgi:hypothetical protein